MLQASRIDELETERQELYQAATGQCPEPIKGQYPPKVGNWEVVGQMMIWVSRN